MSEQEQKQQTKSNEGYWKPAIVTLLVMLIGGMFGFYSDVNKDMAQQKEKIQNLENLYHRDIQEIKDDLKYIKRNMNHNKQYNRNLSE